MDFLANSSFKMWGHLSVIHWKDVEEFSHEGKGKAKDEVWSRLEPRSFRRP